MKPVHIVQISFYLFDREILLLLHQFVKLKDNVYYDGPVILLAQKILQSSQGTFCMARILNVKLDLILVVKTNCLLVILTLV